MKRFLDFVNEALGKKLAAWTEEHPTVNINGVEMRLVDKWRDNLGSIIRDVYVGKDKQTGEMVYCTAKQAKEIVGTGGGETVRNDDDGIEVDGDVGNSEWDKYGQPDIALDPGVKKRKKSRGTSEWEGFEQETADKINKWIANDENGVNDRISDIVDDKDDEFVAVRNKRGSDKSDVLVAHIKSDGEKKNEFYVEAKYAFGQTFNPSVKISWNNGRFTFDYIGSQIPEDITNQEDIDEYQRIMSKSDLGNILTDALDLTENRFLDVLKRIVEAYHEIQDLSRKSSVIEKETVEFPRDTKYFPEIFDQIVSYCLKDKDLQKWKKLNQILQEYNISKDKLQMIYNKRRTTIDRGYNGVMQDFDSKRFLGMNDEQKKLMIFALFNGTGVLRVASVKLVRTGQSTKIDEDDGSMILEDTSGRELIDRVAYAIASWYRDHKKVAYLVIGPNEECPGGVYILDKTYDPLNLQEKVPGITMFRDAYKAIILSLDKESSNTVTSKKVRGFKATAKIDLDYNGLTVDQILKDLVMKPGDDKNDRTKFFKEDEK